MTRSSNTLLGASLALSLFLHGGILGAGVFHAGLETRSRPGALYEIELAVVPADLMAGPRAVSPARRRVSRSRRTQASLPASTSAESPPLPPAAATPASSPPSGAETGGRRSATVFGEEEVDVGATLTHEPLAYYPPAARRDGVEGDVDVRLVLDAEGRVVEASVTGAAGYGFDEAALYAARRLRFVPASKGGQHVWAQVSWRCRFRLEN